MKSKFKTVVVTGAESTGKSALSEWLANYYQVPLIPEFARDFVEKLDRKYNYQDVEMIARNQAIQFERYRNQDHPFIIADTWLIITKVWFEEVFKTVPDWLEPVIQNTSIDIFLVCDTDLPWIPDNVRENGGKKREYLQERYIETIKKYNFQYHIVSGKEDRRFHNALDALHQWGIAKPIH